jgi:hypothetical protein
MPMDGDPIEGRVAQAITRIEAATARIAAAVPLARAEYSGAGPGRDPELEARYAALQQEAGEALQQLDRLIGALDR